MAGSPLYSEKASPICKRMLFEKENGEELIAEEKKETRSAGSVKMTSTSSSSSSSSSTGDDKEADGEMDVDEAEDGGKGGEKNEDVGGVKQENLTGHGLQLVPVRREGEQETEKDEEDHNARTRPPVPTSLLGGMLGAKLPKGWLLKALMPTLNGAIQWDERLSRAWHVALSIQRNLVADIEADQLTKIDHECAMMICRLMGKDLAAIKEQYDTDMMKLIMEPEAVNVRTARSLKEMALSDQLTSFVTNFEELRDLEILPPLVSNKLDDFFRQLDADRLFAQSNFGVDDGPAYQFYLVSNKSECDTKLLCGADAKDVLLRVGQIMSRATQYFMNFEQLSKAEWECFKAEVDWLKKSNQNERTLNRQTTNIKKQWLNKVGATAGAILAFLGGLRSTQDSAAGRRNVMNTVSVNKCAGVLPEIREMASMEKALKSDATLQREVLGKLNTLAAQCWRSAIVPYFIEVLRNMNSRPDDTVITGHRFAGFSIMDEKNGMRPITAAVNDCWGMDVNDLDLDEECFSDVDANEVEGANEDDPDVLQDLEEEFNQNVDDIQV
ncbi:unnamed protein product [Amoebophrya sp. A25]|nr:unnamed protein product [Amoebophrya sp. A25]|eukprot:GSA25T00025506001.1